jgi:hypothetical protein
MVNFIDVGNPGSNQWVSRPGRLHGNGEMVHGASKYRATEG